MTDHVLAIDCYESLVPLKDEIRRGMRRRFRALSVAVPELSASENEEWSDHLRLLYFACGCREGAWFAFVVMLLAPAWLIARAGALDALSWSEAGIWLGAVFVASGIGKLIGLVRARTRLETMVALLGETLLTRGAHAMPSRASDGSEVPRLMRQSPE